MDRIEPRRNRWLQLAARLGAVGPLVFMGVVLLAGGRPRSCSCLFAGVGMIAVGFTPCDAGCVDVTTTGRWHSILSAPGAIGVSLAMVASGSAFRIDGWFSGRWQVTSAALGTLVLLSGPLIALEVFTGLGGLLQRAAMGVAMFWVSAVGVRLASFAGRGAG